MSKVSFHLHPKGLIRIVLILNLSLVSLSNSCIPVYAPDAQLEDQIEYEWENWPEGKRNFNSNCICGGNVAENNPNNNPWDALIKVQYHGSDKTNLCSGTLVNSHFILTAYSCLVQDNVNAYEVWGPASMRLDISGITVWLNEGDEVLTQESSAGVKIAEIIYNPKFIASYLMKRTKENNVVLLRLEKPVNFENRDAPRPVCIHPILNIKSGTQSTISGWRQATVTRTGQSATKSAQRSGIKTVIFEGKDCKGKKSEKKSVTKFSLCTTKKDLNSIEGYEGGRLGVVSPSKNITLQVASLSSSDKSVHFDAYGQYSSFIRYTPIKTILPFIYFHSEKVQATWCREPDVHDFDNLKKSNVSPILRPWIGFTSSSRSGIPGCTCGTHDAVMGRIAGGDAASPHEFKWQVLLKIKVLIGGRKQGTICGGSIINDRFILTAAHCLVQNELLKSGGYPGVSPEDIKAFIGAHLRSGDKDALNVAIKRVWFHPDYVVGQIAQSAYFDYDVALLELENPITFDPEKYIPVCLPTSNKTMEVVGKTCLITGWGLTNPNSGNSLSNILQKIEVPIQANSYCKSIMRSKLTDRFICAGTLNRFKDAGSGDSGGPLSIIGDKDNQYVQVGIVSYGEDVDSSSKATAALYTNVQKVLDAIDYQSHQSNAKWCLP